jgi:hypothetical protein
VHVLQSIFVELCLPQTGVNQMSAHAWSNANLVRLQKAVLCANCDVISEGLNGHCAACGSEALLALSRVLGGTIQTDLPLAALDFPQISSDVALHHFLSAAA